MEGSQFGIDRRGVGVNGDGGVRGGEEGFGPVENPVQTSQGPLEADGFGEGAQNQGVNGYKFSHSRSKS